MLAKPLHSAPTVSASLALAQTYLDAGRHHKAAENLDVAFILYDQAKVTFRQAADAYQVTPPLSQLKSALANAQTSQTLEEEALRQRIAEVYFERAELLGKLGKTAKAQASYKKAQAWGYAETKSATTMPVMSLFTNSAPTMIQAATSTSMSAQAKSALVDYLFKKTLLTLNSLKVSNKPSLFLVYAHNNRDV